MWNKWGEPSDCPGLWLHSCQPVHREGEAELGVPEAGQLEFTEQSPVEERASQREPQKSAQDHHESSV